MKQEKTKFSYRNSPIINAIEQKSLNNLSCYQEDKKYFDEDYTSFADDWKRCAKLFGENIWNVSNTFFKSVIETSDKLLTPELIYNVKSQCGTFIQGDDTYCFIIENSSEYVKIIFTTFFKDSIVSIGDVRYNKNSYDKKEDIFNVEHKYWMSKSKGFEMTNKDYIGSVIGFIIATTNFIKYAPIETKIIESNSKIKTQNNKYVNDTKSNITLLTCTWFTNLVKSDGFKVKGHFRLQPCGVGRLELKLVWVNDYEKTGYTAPARKIAYENNQQ